MIQNNVKITTLSVLPQRIEWNSNGIPTNPINPHHPHQSSPIPIHLHQPKWSIKRLNRWSNASTCKLYLLIVLLKSTFKSHKTHINKHRQCFTEPGQSEPFCLSWICNCRKIFPQFSYFSNHFLHRFYNHVFFQFPPFL